MKTNLVSIIVIFFVASIFISYAFVALTLQKTYSIPENEANFSNATAGGEAIGDEEDFMNVGVLIGPRPGATNVSLDTVIYLIETRPVSNNLTISPNVKIIDVKQKYTGVASRVTTYYPDELLRPNTTYNVSGTIMDLSAWWTFTTGSSIFPKEDYEMYLTPYAWLIALIASIIATIVFAVVVKRFQLRKKSIA